MSNDQINKLKERRKTSNSSLDMFVIFFCITGAVVSIFLFYQDLNASFRSMYIDPAGTVTVKFNTVQRRFSGRMIWDRLFEESPVYSGDLIRIARQSGAILNIAENQIELGESTLIRIQKDAGQLHIEFFSGDINVSADKNGEPVFLTIGDRTIKADPGTVLNAVLTDDGQVLHIIEGNAQIESDGQIIFIPAGTLIAQNANGEETRMPMAAVSSPRPNARFIKSDESPFNVEFSWIRLNMRSGDRLKLEIAQDHDFLNVIRTIDNLESGVVTAVDAGIWNWRLLLDNEVLSLGRMTVTQISAPVLLSPPDETDLKFRYENSQVQFRWSDVTDAGMYTLQIASSPGFEEIAVTSNVQVNTFTAPGLLAGTWYWRVIPVFPRGFEGAARFSRTSSFNLEQISEMTPPALALPVIDSALIVGGNNQDFRFSWNPVKEAQFYTFIISANSDLTDPVLERRVRSNFYIIRRDENILTPGRYYWSVSYTAADGKSSENTQPRSFTALEYEITHRLLHPAERYTTDTADIKALEFTWESNLDYDKRFQVSSFPDFSGMVIDVPVEESNYSGVSIPPGEWYWRFSARQSEQGKIIPTVARRFTLTNTSGSWIFTPVMENIIQETVNIPIVPEPVEMLALQPPQARQTQQPQQQPRTQQTRQAPPPQVQPPSPPPVPSPVLPEQAPVQAPEQAPVQPQADQTMRQTPMPVPLLDTPENMIPQTGHSIGRDELRRQRTIDFSWQSVEGANSYILTIYRDVFPRRQQIFQTETENELGYSFDISRFPDSGNYIWQIEAVAYDNNDRIIRRGKPGENTFDIDFQRPGRVRTRDMGILYGIE